MTTYTLNVHVDTARLVELKDAGYHLCLARKVNNTYDCVWRADERYLMQNQYRWAQEYQVFASQTSFQVGNVVRAESNVQQIAYKQECDFDKSGIMHPPRTDPKGVDGTFKVLNDYSAISFAVDAKLNGTFSVIYQTPLAIKGEIQFTPKDEVRVWFQLTLKTGTIVSDIIGKHIDVSFGTAVEKSISYGEDGDWHLVG
ncbi:hypothetical protein GYMLUDRAFT_247700 [Collybiopsis luxurians FD-317 M1]|uniref:Uncharacterized protein n=1 Tax=Collybiopsis luxurians FD-317 M1 TaxID=944289 RepID=A0A0D0C2X2_9AGAR|nr:hypothetical protein GYMLUDRAFT_247700 [Collybiopsis luxurians FD-317 M1]